MPGIFISYRHDDTAGYAGRLADDLTEKLGPGAVFMDIQALKPGIDYVEAIEQSIGACDTLILLIGRRWLTTTDEQGRRRLDDPVDLHRIEVASALKRGLRVIPVLVDGGRMPRQEELPADLALLARRQAYKIDDARWRYDVQQLVEVLQEEARRRELERLYADAEQAFERQAWDLAIRGFEAVLARDPTYRDAAARLEETERQKRLAELYAEGRELHRARRWHDVDAAFQRIHALDPAYADPDQLLASARRALADEASDNDLAALYAQGRLHVEFRRWAQAVETLEALQAKQPGYRDTAALLLKARRELERRQAADASRAALEADGGGPGQEVDGGQGSSRTVALSVALGWLVGAAIGEAGYVIARYGVGPMALSTSWLVGGVLAATITGLALAWAPRHRVRALGGAVVAGCVIALLDGLVYTRIRVPLSRTLAASRVSPELALALDWSLMVVNAMLCAVVGGLVIGWLVRRRRPLAGTMLFLVAGMALVGAGLGALAQLALQYLLPWPDDVWSARGRFAAWLVLGLWLVGRYLIRAPTPARADVADGDLPQPGQQAI